MHDSGKGPIGAIQLVKNSGAGKVSARKIAANRQNAQKSTGPKTLMGKTFSRRNAIKHGLFTRQAMDFMAHSEDAREYGELLNGLWDQYQPIGRAEELEVERIAICWWRLKRAWRYENVANRVALRNFGSRELGEQAEYCKTLDEQEKAVILLLQSAGPEIEVTGEISQEFKQKIFATMPGLEGMWPMFEQIAQAMLNTPALSKILQESNTEERASALAGVATIMGVKILEGVAQLRRAAFTEIAIGQHVIPNSEVLDKLLRYETAVERSLGGALGRLERLQRRRKKEEPVPPPVSVRMTQ
jgi:hypothetical protein